MANRNFNRAQNLEKEVKSLFAEISIGSSGAPTLVRGLGVESVERDTAGVYILTLQDKYNRLMHCSVSIVAPTVEDLTAQIEAHDVSSAKTVTIRTVALDADGAPEETDPADGDTLFVRIDVKNSSAL